MKAIADHPRYGQSEGAGADAKGQHQLLEGAVEAVGGRRALRRYVVVDHGVIGGELQRHREAADAEQDEHDPVRPIRPQRGTGGVKQAGQDAVPDERVAKAEASQDRRGNRLHQDSATTGRKSQEAAFGRRHAEADLHHERQQEGLGALGDAAERTADHGDAKRRDAHQTEIEDRRHPALAQRVGDIGRPASPPAPIRASVADICPAPRLPVSKPKSRHDKRDSWKVRSRRYRKADASPRASSG